MPVIQSSLPESLEMRIEGLSDTDLRALIDVIHFSGWVLQPGGWVSKYGLPLANIIDDWSSGLINFGDSGWNLAEYSNLRSKISETARTFYNNQDRLHAVQMYCINTLVSRGYEVRVAPPMHLMSEAEKQRFRGGYPVATFGYSEDKIEFFNYQDMSDGMVTLHAMNLSEYINKNLSNFPALSGSLGSLGVAITTIVIIALTVLELITTVFLVWQMADNTDAIEKASAEDRRSTEMLRAKMMESARMVKEFEEEREAEKKVTKKAGEKISQAAMMSAVAIGVAGFVVFKLFTGEK